MFLNEQERARLAEFNLSQLADVQVKTTARVAATAAIALAAAEKVGAEPEAMRAWLARMGLGSTPAGQQAVAILEALIAEIPRNSDSGA